MPRAAWPRTMTLAVVLALGLTACGSGGHKYSLPASRVMSQRAAQKLCDAVFGPTSSVQRKFATLPLVLDARPSSGNLSCNYFTYSQALAPHGEPELVLGAIGHGGNLGGPGIEVRHGKVTVAAYSPTNTVKFPSSDRSWLLHSARRVDPKTLTDNVQGTLPALPVIPAPARLVELINTANQPPAQPTSQLVTPSGTLSVALMGHPATVPGSMLGVNYLKLSPGAGNRFAEISVAWHMRTLDSLVCDQGEPSVHYITLSVNRNIVTKLSTLGLSSPISYLVDVPKNGTADLTVTTQGTTQQLSLITGLPVASPVNLAMDNPNRAAAPSPFSTTYTKTDSDYQEQYRLQLGRLTNSSSFYSLEPFNTAISSLRRSGSVVLCPYIASKGWAPAGKEWLRISGVDALGLTPQAIQNNTYFSIYTTLGNYRSWTVTIGGKPYDPVMMTATSARNSAYQPADHGLIGNYEGNPSYDTVYFLVPTSTRSLSASLATTFHVTPDGEAVTHNVQSLTWSNPPLRFNATFGPYTG